MTARTAALLTLLALAEAAILSPLMWLLVPAPKSANPTALVGIVWAVLLVLSLQWRWLASRGLSLNAQRALMGAWFVVLIVAGELDSFGPSPTHLPDVIEMLPGFVAALLIWWRGMALGNHDLHPRAVDMHFQLGMLILIITSLASLFSRNTETLPGIAAFFFASLTTMPLANLEFTHQHRLGRPAPMTRHWWAWVIGASIAVVALGLIATALLTGKSAVDVLVTLIGVLLLPLVLILALIPVAFFDWLLGLLRRMLAGFGQLGQLLPPPPTQPDAAQTNSGSGINLPPEANFAIGIAVFVALAIIVILLMQQARKVANAPARNARDLDGNLAPPVLSDASGTQSRFGLDQLRRWLAAMTIRRLYARATHEATKRGHKRLASQTPYDFLAPMQTAFPTAEADARAITDAYVAAHYGEVPDSQAALDALKAAWERMRATEIGRK